MFGSEELCSSKVVSAIREEFSTDEELAVLPRHTKVVVTGNNRTKSVLVGLQGVVKKAVGLGGWHWLVLKNGVEVKLQRNALSVLEHPTGKEDDEDDEGDGSSFSSETGDADFCSRTMHTMHRPRARFAKFTTSVKLTSLGDGVKRVRPVCSPHCGVKLGNNLRTESLIAYCRYYNLGSFDSNSTRNQLVLAVERHWDTQQQPMNDSKVIPEFVKAASRRRKGKSSLKEPRNCKERHLQNGDV